MRQIDLNCDCGEGIGNDAAILPFVTSANIACGAHAGDTGTMRETARLARECGVVIGAHPGFRDRENFGRLEISFDSPGQAFELVFSQLLALGQHTPMRHVKPHGALYNQAARAPGLSAEIARAIQAFDPSLLVYGLAGSVLLSASESIGLRVAHEVFADRTYQPDGSLTPRARPDALIEDEERCVEQALRLVIEGKVRATDGSEVALRADTICLHGDGAQAVSFARRLREEFARAGVQVAALA